MKLQGESVCQGAPCLCAGSQAQVVNKRASKAPPQYCQRPKWQLKAIILDFPASRSARNEKEREMKKIRDENKPKLEKEQYRSPSPIVNR